MRAEQVFGVAIFPIQKNRSLLGLSFRYQDEIVKKRCHLTDGFDDSSIVRRLPLFQPVQESCQIAGVVSQVTIVFNVPVPSDVRRLRRVVKMKNLNPREQIPDLRELVLVRRQQTFLVARSQLLGSGVRNPTLWRN
jgi:hypothetical protein